MTDKRKKLAKSISAKTGMSHVGAINAMNKNRVRISREPVTSVQDLFVVDTFDIRDEMAPLFGDVPAKRLDGGFVRLEVPSYERPEGVTAYIIGEEGENILAVSKPKRVIVPLVWYRADYIKDGVIVGSNAENILTAITDRMEALLDVVPVCACDMNKETPGITEAEARSGRVEEILSAEFAGARETIRIYRRDQWIFGIRGYAGIWVQEKGSTRHGLITFSDRVFGIQVV